MHERSSDFFWDLSLGLRRSWFRGISTFLAIAFCFVAAVLFWPRTYHSEAKLYLRLGRESVRLDPTATTGQMVGLAETREREILSALELLRTRALFEQVVDECGVDSILNEPRALGYGGIADWSHLRPDLTQWLPKSEPVNSAALSSEQQEIVQLRRRENAVRQLMHSVISSSPKNSNVIIVQCKAASPIVAQQRLACLLRHYQEQHLRLHRTSGSFAFFDAQVREKKGRLDEKLVKLRDAKNRISVASIEGEKELLSREATAITQNLLEAQAAATASKARLDTLLAELAKTDQSGELPAASNTSSDAVDMMQSRLFELEIEHQRLLAQLQPTHPKIKAVAEQLATVKTVLKRQEAIVEKSNHLEQQERIAASQAQRTELYSKLRTLNEQELLIADLERQTRLLEEEYRRAEENCEQARMDEELTKNQISNINLAQAPTFAAKPISPNVGWNLSLGLTAAILGAVSVVLRGTMRHESIDDLRVNGPMLGAHPKHVERQLELQI